MQDNHVHLIVEAENKARLASGMRGLAVRMARRMNRLLSLARSRSDGPAAGQKRARLRAAKIMGSTPRAACTRSVLT
jgi:hypothetical protein